MRSLFMQALMGTVLSRRRCRPKHWNVYLGVTELGLASPAPEEATRKPGTQFWVVFKESVSNCPFPGLTMVTIYSQD